MILKQPSLCTNRSSGRMGHADEAHVICISRAGPSTRIGGQLQAGANSSSCAQNVAGCIWWDGHVDVVCTEVNVKIEHARGKSSNKVCVADVFLRNFVVKVHDAHSKGGTGSHRGP